MYTGKQEIRRLKKREIVRRRPAPTQEFYSGSTKAKYHIHSSQSLPLLEVPLNDPGKIEIKPTTPCLRFN